MRFGNLDRSRNDFDTYGGHDKTGEALHSRSHRVLHFAGHALHGRGIPDGKTNCEAHAITVDVRVDRRIDVISSEARQTGPWDGTHFGDLAGSSTRDSLHDTIGDIGDPPGLRR
jgi:hypothetical protein